jgi:hypothetical protein
MYLTNHYKRKITNCPCNQGTGAVDRSYQSWPICLVFIVVKEPFDPIITLLTEGIKNTKKAKPTRALTLL